MMVVFNYSFKGTYIFCVIHFLTFEYIHQYKIPKIDWHGHRRMVKRNLLILFDDLQNWEDKSTIELSKARKVHKAPYNQVPWEKRTISSASVIGMAIE